MELPNGQLEIEFWEDWGMSGRPGEDFETGRRTEPIWRALLREGRWTIRMRRRWRSSDGTFGPHPVPFGLSGFQPPRELLEAP